MAASSTAWCWEASSRAGDWILDASDPAAAGATPVLVVPAGGAQAALSALPPAARRWADASGAKWGGKSGELLLVPGPE
ncbi:hypothetical protein MNEG_14649, partial [Monoraphidium neglectum]